MGTWIALTEAERKSDEEAKAREVRIGQSLKINHDQRCNVPQDASQSQRQASPCCALPLQWTLQSNTKSL